MFIVILAMFDPCVHMLFLRMFTGDEPVISYARSFAINLVILMVGIGFVQWLPEEPEQWQHAVAIGIPALLAYVLTVKLTLTPVLNAIPVVILFLTYKGAMMYFLGDSMAPNAESGQLFPEVQAQLQELIEGDFWFSEE